MVPSNFIWNHHAIAKKMYCGVGVHKQDVQIRLASYLTGGFLLQAVRGKQDYTSGGMYMPFIFSPVSLISVTSNKYGLGYLT